VHFLLSTEPDRSKQLARIHRAAGAGVPRGRGVAADLRRLRSPPGSQALHEAGHGAGVPYRFKEGIETVKGDAVKLSDAEIEATLGDELLGVAVEFLPR